MARPPALLLVLIAALAAGASLYLSPVSAANCHPEDQKALLAIKQFWKNPRRLASWTPSTACCDWEAMSCDAVTGRVVGLHISDDANISGAIPPAVGDLPYLRELDFHNLSRLTGPIPSVLARLLSLSSIRLDGNALTGPVPAFIGQLQELRSLNLAFNRLTGPIPGALGGLTNLHTLQLDHNRLNGSFPAELGNLPAGANLLLSHNQLYGPLPLSLGAVDFSVLDLSWNQLSSDALFLFGPTKKELTYIDLSRNNFDFDLTKLVFPTIAQLNTVNLSHNRIFGTIPKQITELRALHSFDVSYNHLCGEIPTGGNLAEFKPEAYAHNGCLCGTPLPPCK